MFDMVDIVINVSVPLGDPGTDPRNRDAFSDPETETLSARKKVKAPPHEQCSMKH